MVEREVIQRRLAVLADALADLRRYRARFSAQDLASDRDAQHMVMHALYVASQAAIDIALHAGAATEQHQSITYQQAFDRLVAGGLLEQSLAVRMKGWAGLRNVLAHQYVTIDLARIAATLASDLGELEDFARIAATWQ
ncbi:MAG: DUF86 domain-containing protein [Planctomycetes bacterium]|nr:DUF86 domain-containing protein [Planctomycetota bacterium]